jgi:hypothetical protein
MQNKIVVICVSMLCIATAIPVVTSLNDGILTPMVSCSGTERSSLDNWIELQKLLASDGEANDAFGLSVSLCGDTALIGAFKDSDNGQYSGSAYVFTHTDDNWTLQQKLLASDGEAHDFFGSSVYLNSDTALIGAPGVASQQGAAYVFIRTGTIWTQQVKLLASDGVAYDQFGCSVSVNGNTALIGAYGHDYNKGIAYIFNLTSTTWTQQAELLAPDGATNDQFGFAVALDGDTALIGAHWDDDNGKYDSGSVYVFIRTGVTWSQQQKLLASDAESGDEFGTSVSLSGDTALIGAPKNDMASVPGSAYVFTRTGTTWTQQAKLVASDGIAPDFFGCAVSVDEETALVGAFWGDGITTDSGSTYVFTRSGTTWTQQAKLFASDGEGYDRFGQSVSISGENALIGAFEDDNGKGSAYMFTKGTVNQPPVIPPAPSGPDVGVVGVDYMFSAVTTDPEEDNVSYFFDWGDGENSGWVGPFPSGATATAAHAWSEEGTYLVKVKAKDENGAETDWSPTHSIAIGAAPDLTVGDFKGGLGVHAVVKNSGNGTATNITWSIDLEGKLVFLGGHTTGNISSLAPGGTAKITTGLILGLGKITIEATATCEQGVSCTEDGTAIVLLFFVVGVSEPLP